MRRGCKIVPNVHPINFKSIKRDSIFMMTSDLINFEYLMMLINWRITINDFRYNPDNIQVKMKHDPEHCMLASDND